ncbi:hypothetical protein B1B_01174 [mine drainage metagenome]|uniref:Transposase n=1 Tax=mine drainage metagenome TaxID=410659 RepID=T1D4J7_9ZZZZ
MLLATGILRFGLDLPEKNVRALLAQGWGIPLSLSDVSRLSTEFLVRWRMFCEEALPTHASEMGPLVVQIDGTVVENGPVTCRFRHALTGVTLWAEQIEAESAPEIARALRTFQARYGVPLHLLRDGSPAFRKAMEEVFPGVSQGEDHWHFLDDLGPVVLPDYPALRDTLVKDHGLSRLAERSRTLPTKGKTIEEVERVWMRAVLEWVEAARDHTGGFPFRLAYLEVACRLEAVRRWAGQMVQGNGRRGILLPDMVELKLQVIRLLEREGVSWHRVRTGAEAGLLTELRRAMRVERERRSRPELAPLTREDVAQTRREIDLALTRFAAEGEWAQAIVATVVKRFEAHGPYLWAEVPGQSVVIRSTVPLEQDHGADRRGVRHRTGREETGQEMGRLGSLLAFWSNMRCEWFRDQVLPGVNLWEEFARRDPEEVRRRVCALPREGRRPRVVLPRGEKARACLESLVKLVAGEEPLEPHLSKWMESVSPPPGEVTGIA